MSNIRDHLRNPKKLNATQIKKLYLYKNIVLVPSEIKFKLYIERYTQWNTQLQHTHNEYKAFYVLYLYFCRLHNIIIISYGIILPLIIVVEILN